ncbi:hypothetical protein [Arsenophonus nasoniae]|uniref:hypothetical protein n=1 Tax=Arsenophonus nasoniae TaxID=638 RepID=UPI00387A2DF7
MKDNNIKINDFFHDLEIIGSAADDISKFYAMHKKLFNNSEKECKIDVNKSPILLTSSDTKNAYKNANFKQIEKIVKDSDDDTRAIYTNIKDNGVKAWTKVSSGGKEFYMSFSNKASIWCMTEKTEKILTKEGDIKYSAVVQMGIYSSSGQIAGINTYNITLPILLGEVVSALLVARLISFAIAEGASFLIASILSRMGAFAVEIGLGPVSFIIGSYALSAVVASLIFAIVFVGIMYLWNWVNKKYTIKLQIFNWDENYIWNIVDDYLLNAKLANDEHNREHDFYISLPKMIKPNETITPPLVLIQSFP